MKTTTQKTNVTFNLNELGASELLSFRLVLEAYQNDAFMIEIFETGFNLNTGYIYISLENNITIASCFGQSVDFIVYDFETGEEHFFDTYLEAEQYINK